MEDGSEKYELKEMTGIHRWTKCYPALPSPRLCIELMALGKRKAAQDIYT